MSGAPDGVAVPRPSWPSVPPPADEGPAPVPLEQAWADPGDPPAWNPAGRSTVTAWSSDALPRSSYRVGPRSCRSAGDRVVGKDHATEGLPGLVSRTPRYRCVLPNRRRGRTRHHRLSPPGSLMSWCSRCRSGAFRASTSRRRLSDPSPGDVILLLVEAEGTNSVSGKYA